MCVCVYGVRWFTLVSSGLRLCLVVYACVWWFMPVASVLWFIALSGVQCPVVYRSVWCPVSGGLRLCIPGPAIPRLLLPGDRR